MTLAEYWMAVGDAYDIYRGRWRYGQTVFNVLAEHRPDLAERVRGTFMDPFHVDSRLSEFIPFIVNNWERS